MPEKVKPLKTESRTTLTSGNSLGSADRSVLHRGTPHPQHPVAPGDTAPSAPSGTGGHVTLSTQWQPQPTGRSRLSQTSLTVAVGRSRGGTRWKLNERILTLLGMSESSAAAIDSL